MTEQDVIRLAKQIGIEPADAIRALHSERAARSQGVRIYKWQRAHQDQATILMRLAQQNEANQSMYDD